MSDDGSAAAVPTARTMPDPGRPSERPIGSYALRGLLIPPAAQTVLEGPDLEEIMLVRDEMANMAWAVEHTTENGIGAPWLGSEGGWRRLLLFL